MTDNTLLAHRTQLYEIVARNGQVLMHGYTSQKKALAAVKDFKRRYPEDSLLSEVMTRASMVMSKKQ